ncbi:hypothetical protein H0I76_17890 [Limibaculum sp. M0105]|uniref:Uncharacterized protein n=1 Tax=Thermohalobaculum xanthum TaxID=2753746 RepID=A0A8J7MB67_9RHOB|nr:hypothetical protein [Thermohalobaculum xanthum]MBK0401073.1 hypothetical protein [Thermohalobaculum xanthum]
MKHMLDGRSTMAVFSGGAKVSELEKKLARMEARVAELEQRLARSETRFEMSVRFFEHRVDQIYARILPVLGRETGLFAGPDEPVASPALVARPAGEVESFSSLADASDGFLRPGRYGSPFAEAGFRLALGLAVERDGAVEVQSDQRGAAMFGPYKRMTPGDYRLLWTVAPAPDATGSVALGFDLYSPTIDRVIAHANLTGVLDGPRTVELPVTIGPELSEAVFELRVHQQGGAAARIAALDLMSA